MITHYATYGYTEGESTHETRCGLTEESGDMALSKLTRDPLAVTCVECKR